MYYNNGYQEEPAMHHREIARILNFPIVSVWRTIRQFKLTKNLGECVVDKRFGKFKKIPYNVQ